VGGAVLPNALQPDEKPARNFGVFSRIQPRQEIQEVLERFEAGGGAGELVGDTWTLSDIEDVREVELNVDNQRVVVQRCRGGEGGPCAMRIVGHIKAISIVECFNIILLVDAISEHSKIVDSKAVVSPFSARDWL